MHPSAFALEKGCPQQADVCVASLWTSQATTAADLTDSGTNKKTGGTGSYCKFAKTFIKCKSTKWKRQPHSNCNCSFYNMQHEVKCEEKIKCNYLLSAPRYCCDVICEVRLGILTWMTEFIALFCVSDFFSFLFFSFLFFSFLFFSFLFQILTVDCSNIIRCWHSGLS